MMCMLCYLCMYKANKGVVVVVVLERTAKKCTKTYNARAELLFYSLNLLFGDVLVHVVAVVCLMENQKREANDFQKVRILF